MKLLAAFLKNYLPADELSSALENFRVFREELKRWNEKTNLTAIVSDEEIETKHFIDSLEALTCGIKPGDSLLDVGAGAGFPGIPLKIVVGGLRLSLAEASGKKAAFIEHIVGKLELSDTKVYASRSEDLPPVLRDTFDFVVSRAAGPPVVAAEYCLPWLRLGGRALIYASARQTAPSVSPPCAASFDGPPKDDHAAEKISRVVLSLGGRLMHEEWYRLPGGTETKRKIVIVEKTATTPEKYPRRAGMAAKRPL